MKKKYLSVLTVSIIFAVLMTACSNAAAGQGVEAQTSEDTMAEDTAAENVAEDDVMTEYEINDMLPRPSDDTFIMSVEDAMKLMGKNPDGTDITDDSTETDTEK